MRGKLITWSKSRRSQRIIPASAGQTQQQRHNIRQRADHPRECGANKAAGTGHSTCRGSSPRVRGKHQAVVAHDAQHRIIPASAGQTECADACVAAAADHPRECGANYCPRVFRLSAIGSSPRVRGKPFFVFSAPARGRIIPASAGQTIVALLHGVLDADHPRECGANVYARVFAAVGGGSSPRVRGKRSITWSISKTMRIIPASAGQTGALIYTITRHADHPRECGANGVQAILTTNNFGSSPRVRGKLGFNSMQFSSVRIIPASAGQTNG